MGFPMQHHKFKHFSCVFLSNDILLASNQNDSLFLHYLYGKMPFSFNRFGYYRKSE